MPWRTGSWRSSEHFIECEEAEEDNSSQKRHVEEIIVVVERLGQEREGWVSEDQGVDEDSQSSKATRDSGHPKPERKRCNGWKRHRSCMKRG